MTIESKYPFQLKNLFFISLSFRRAPELPDPLEIPLKIEVKHVEPGFPLIQVNMKISSQDDEVFPFSAEVVGLFDYVGDKKIYDRELNLEFVFQRGLHMLWSYSSQMIRLITGQMGMNPLNLIAPVSFAVEQHRSSEG